MPDVQTPTGLLSLDDYCDAIGCAKLLRLTLRQMLAGVAPQSFAAWGIAHEQAEHQAAQAFNQLARQRQASGPRALQGVPDNHVGETPPPAKPAAKPRRRPVKTGGAPPPPAAG